MCKYINYKLGCIYAHACLLHVHKHTKTMHTYTCTQTLTHLSSLLLWSVMYQSIIYSALTPHMHPPPHGGGSSGEEREGRSIWGGEGGKQTCRQTVANLNDQRRMCDSSHLFWWWCDPSLLWGWCLARGAQSAWGKAELLRKDNLPWVRWLECMATGVWGNASPHVENVGIGTLWRFDNYSGWEGCGEDVVREGRSEGGSSHK